MHSDISTCASRYNFYIIAIGHFFYKLIGSEVLGGGNFDEGTGRIWLDNVECTGSERRLTNCLFNSSGVDSCTHAQDAGVRCLTGSAIFIAQCS